MLTKPVHLDLLFGLFFFLTLFRPESNKALKQRSDVTVLGQRLQVNQIKVLGTFGLEYKPCKVKENMAYSPAQCKQKKQDHLRYFASRVTKKNGFDVECGVSRRLCLLHLAFYFLQPFSVCS